MPSCLPSTLPGSAASTLPWGAWVRPAGCRAVSRLLESGRIERREDTDDRRRSKLYLTEEGHEVHSEVVPVAHAYEAKLMAGLSEQEARLLERLLDSLESSATGIAREGFGMTTGVNPKIPCKAR
jgi:hypothetical protein